MGDPVGTLRQLGQTPLVPAPTLGKLERRVRRRRLRRRATVSGLAVGALATALVVVLRDDPERVVRTAGPDQQELDDVPQGVTGHVLDGVPLFVVRTDADVNAFVARSTHVAGPLWWCPSEQLFVSPDNGEAYEADGTAVAGPAPRDLDSVAVTVESGVVRIDPHAVRPGAPRHTVPSTIPDGPWEASGFCSNHVEPPAPTDAAVTGGPIPRVWAQPPAPTDVGGLAALVSGVLAYDEAQDCLLLELERIRYPVVWPAGTVGISEGPGVELRDGSTVHVGDEVSGGGGYLDGDEVSGGGGYIADRFQIPDGCLPSSGEVAVFNANGALQVVGK
jgi:Rieske Fe-S protein